MNTVLLILVVVLIGIAFGIMGQGLSSIDESNRRSARRKRMYGSKYQEFEMKVWLGAHCWGWQLFGVSFKDKWFLGFSRRATPLADKYD